MYRSYNSIARIHILCLAFKVKSFNIKYIVTFLNFRSLTQNYVKETVNAHEVEHHSSMKDYWWNSDGPLNALHSFNPLR